MRISVAWRHTVGSAMHPRSTSSQRPNCRLCTQRMQTHISDDIRATNHHAWLVTMIDVFWVETSQVGCLATLYGRMQLDLCLALPRVELSEHFIDRHVEGGNHFLRVRDKLSIQSWSTEQCWQFMFKKGSPMMTLSCNSGYIGWSLSMWASIMSILVQHH